MKKLFIYMTILSSLQPLFLDAVNNGSESSGSRVPSLKTVAISIVTPVASYIGYKLLKRAWNLTRNVEETNTNVKVVKTGVNEIKNEQKKHRNDTKTVLKKTENIKKDTEIIKEKQKKANSALSETQKTLLKLQQTLKSFQSENNNGIEKIDTQLAINKKLIEDEHNKTRSRITAEHVETRAFVQQTIKEEIHNFQQQQQQQIFLKKQIITPLNNEN